MLQRVAIVIGFLVALSGQVLADINPLFSYHATVQNGNLLGSSFELQSGLVATNAHVVAGKRVGASVQLYVPGRRQTVRGVVLAVSERMDLALLQVPPGILETPRARAATGGAERLQLVGVVARRGPKAVQAGTGQVVRRGVTVPQFGPGMILRTQGVTFGFSGGPVFDSRDQVVGMLTALRTRPEGTEALVIPISDIRAEARRILRNP